MAPSEFVRDMFNGYALTFDESLKALRYQSPELLRQAVDVLLARMPAGDAWADRGHSRAWRVFDGGCGTGLCGPLFRNLTQSLSGVDLSENMVALARKRGVYDELSVGELVAALASWAVRPEAGAGLHGDSAGGAVEKLSGTAYLLTTLQYSTAPYSIVQYSTVQCSIA